MTGAEVLSRFAQAGYTLALNGEEIRAAGPAAPSDELRALVAEHRDALKVALLLLNPPPWLVRLLDMHAIGRVTEVRRVDTATGRPERYPVCMSLKNIAAAVGAALGLPRKRWLKIVPEVEARLASWESRKVGLLVVVDEGEGPPPRRNHELGRRRTSWKTGPAGDAYDKLVARGMRSVETAIDELDRRKATKSSPCSQRGRQHEA